MKFDDPQVKEQMVAVKYRPEQDLTRLAGINMCEKKNLVLELYAGMGGSTKLFKETFKQVISNDINLQSPAEYHMSADKFLRLELVKLPKIDLIDFDAYGCPSEEIKLYFSTRKSLDLPLVVTVSDGLGIWMKRSKNIKRLRERYLLGDYKFDERHPWREHKGLINCFMTSLARIYDMNLTELVTVQTKHKNYVLGAWLFTKQNVL